MDNILSNGILEVSISDVGAEMRSLRRVAAPTEYIWQGDPAYWNGHSPLLFPIVGRLAGDETRIGGQAYSMKRHGFASHMEFRKTADEDRHMAFTCQSDEHTRSCYPFDFNLTVDYRLLRNVLTVGWSVENKGSRPMPFQIGGHPAFNYPNYKPQDSVHALLSFDTPLPFTRTEVSPDGYLLPITHTVETDKDGMLPLTDSTFACDTIIDATARTHRITMHDKNGRPWITIKHDMPVTAIWSPCGGKAPFVCIEPWQGCCDREGYDGDFAGRPLTITVMPGETWRKSYQIIVEY